MRSIGLLLSIFFFCLIPRCSAQLWKNVSFGYEDFYNVTLSAAQLHAKITARSDSPLYIELRLDRLASQQYLRTSVSLEKHQTSATTSPCSIKIYTARHSKFGQLNLEKELDFSFPTTDRVGSAVKAKSNLFYYFFWKPGDNEDPLWQNAVLDWRFSLTPDPCSLYNDTTTCGGCVLHDDCGWCGQDTQFSGCWMMDESNKDSSVYNHRLPCGITLISGPDHSWASDTCPRVPSGDGYLLLTVTIVAAVGTCAVIVGLYQCLQTCRRRSAHDDGDEIGALLKMEPIRFDPTLDDELDDEF